ncbi:hypothetical protein BU25DRAFT_407673 [Macroventuria anomochaeta]|uniref:Uncharacterized protein n=1 Tax=Macroventuria anomochaeta TaxID=301207 RepID=A0ACB6SA06_9PLEO|nr:uncharacterized protein BU25DRAFT_407673 [Macroventuria anomochaeta]KAF2631125.1 hypothetical protein BU25DRAFT_407673 [Macroventuria anomochaeta]
MVTQRRYSVTGQTPPDDAEALKAGSPKLHALDTSVQTSCGLCEGGAEASKALEESATAQLRGRKMSPTCTITRTSSKRSATQLPSPSSPTCELPPKIARYRLSYNESGMDMDTDTDSDATDVFRDRSDKEEEDWMVNSQATSMPSTPEFSLPLSALRLPDTEDEGIDVEDLALSPPHSRNHSLNCAHLDEKALQRDWAVFKQASALLESQIMHLEYITPPQPQTQELSTHTAVTFLTLPPEIRHQIYRLDTDLVKTKPLCYCLENAGSKIQHPFASVSTQIRREALAIFYSYNTWAIKTEYKMFYEAFQDWIIRLGDGASQLRLVTLSVRGKLFKPVKTHPQSVVVNGQIVVIHTGHVPAGGVGVLPSPTREEMYSPPDGEASFNIDLSEKYVGGQVQLTRNDGTADAGEKGRVQLEKMVVSLWEKRRDSTLNGQDWISLVDGFLSFVGMIGGAW